MTTLERMARAWWEASNPRPPFPWDAVRGWGRNAVLDRMRRLRDGEDTGPIQSTGDTFALAVLRKEQAPRWDAPTSDPLTSDAMADAMATMEEESARLDAGHVAALGINPRRAHLVSVAPPPPCATCGGTTWVGEPGQRVGCPDCRPEVTR